MSKIVRVVVEIEDILFDDETAQEAGEEILRAILHPSYYLGIRLLSATEEEEDE
jgi:hypothetical protein